MKQLDLVNADQAKLRLDKAREEPKRREQELGGRPQLAEEAEARAKADFEAKHQAAFSHSSKGVLAMAACASVLILPEPARL